MPFFYLENRTSKVAHKSEKAAGRRRQRLAAGWQKKQEKFAKAKSDIESKIKDAVILTPLMINVPLDYEDYMKIDFAMVEIADILILLPDWTESAGAKREKEFAESLKKKIVLLSDL